MANVEHTDIAEDGIHIPHRWKVANVTEMDAITTLVTDIDKLVLRTDEDTYYRLKSTEPNVWQKIASGDMLITTYDPQNISGDTFDRTNHTGTQVGSTITPDNTVGTVIHLDNMEKQFDHLHSAGIMHGCDLTDNIDGTIDLASGYGLLRALPDDHSTLYTIEIDAQVNLTMLEGVNYVSVDWNSGVPQFITSADINSFNCMDTCVAYVVVREGTVISWIDAREQNVDSNRKARRLFLQFNRFIHLGGGSMLGDAGALSVNVTAGKFNFMLEELSHDAFDTSIVGLENVNVFEMYYKDGVGGFTDVYSQKVVSTTLYDDGTGTLATIPNSKFGIMWFYLTLNNPDHLVSMVGQEVYASQADADAASPPSEVPPIIEGLGVLIGYVTFQESATEFTNVLSAFSLSLTASQAVNHNGLSGIQGGAADDYQHSTTTEKTNYDTAYTHSQAAHAPSDANNYVHPTGDGNIHVPANSTTNDGKVLTASAVAGVYTWEIASVGFTDPMTTRGDIIIRDPANLTARLGVGTIGQVLSSDGTDVSWTTPASGGGIGEYISTSIAISSNDSALANDDGSTNGNIGIGTSAGAVLTTGYSNVMLGDYTNATATSNYHTICIGYGAGRYGSNNSQYNINMGYNAALYTTGNSNVVLGRNAGAVSSSSYSSSVLIGNASGASLTSGLYSIFLGYNSGKNVSGGHHNICIGADSMASSSGAAGDNNIAIGNFAGRYIVGGNTNVCIGKYAGSDIINESSQLRIANNATTALLHGDFSAETLTLNGEVTVRDFLTLTPTATTPNNNSFFVDSADNVLKFKDNAGTVKTVTLA